MLDIYFAPSSTVVVPEGPGSLEFAGSIDLHAHRSLADLLEKGRQAGAELPYFRDSLLNPEQVRLLLEIFVANASEAKGNATFAAIGQLLERAADEGAGLVAFSD
jgi:hypothetical protein